MTDPNEQGFGTGSAPDDNEWDWGAPPEPEPAPVAPVPAPAPEPSAAEDEWDWGEPEPEPVSPVHTPTPRPWPSPAQAEPEGALPVPGDGLEEWEDDEDDDPEDAPGVMDRVKETFSDKKKAAGIAIAGIAVVLGGAMFMGGGGAEEEVPAETVASTTQSTTTRTSTTTSSPEPGAKAVTEVEPFVKALVKVMNDRDAEAYYALLSPDAKETATESVARSAIEGLQEGAKYTYKVTEAEVLDSKAVVRFTLTATVGSSSSEQKMELQLSEHDGDWLMELP